MGDCRMIDDIIYKLYPNIRKIEYPDMIAYDVDGNIVSYDKDLVETEYNKVSYIEKRQKEYPSIADQLDMLWHAVNNGENLKDSQWFNSIKEVKEKYNIDEFLKNKIPNYKLHASIFKLFENEAEMNAVIGRLESNGFAIHRGA